MEIEGYSNYLVYEDGRVFSKMKRKYLKGGDNGSGYKYVNLSNDGIQKNMTIHRLVALHYIPNPHNYCEVDHIDRDKSNNDISNLRWVDHYTNIHNIGMIKSNTSGHKHICFDKSRNKYKYCKTTRGKTIQKRFDTLEEAIEFKNSLI